MTGLALPLRAERKVGSFKLLDAGGLIIIDWNENGLIVDTIKVAAIVKMSEALPVLIEAAQDVIDCTPENRATYPDGPCIEKAERRALVAALITAKAVPAPLSPNCSVT